MLTARIEEIDQLFGLELGADGYSAIPFLPRLVVARVRALLRRSDSVGANPQILGMLDLEIDLDAYRIHRAGELLELTPTEFTLHATLAAQPGRAYSRLQLFEASS